MHLPPDGRTASASARYRASTDRRNRGHARERICHEEADPHPRREAIEPSLPFWVGALGFAKTVEVPIEGRRPPYLAAIEEAVAEHELLVARKKTFYGAEEIFVREPGGNVVGFAQFGADEE